MNEDQYRRSIQYERELAGAWLRLRLDELCSSLGIPPLHRTDPIDPHWIEGREFFERWGE